MSFKQTFWLEINRLEILVNIKLILLEMMISIVPVNLPKIKNKYILIQV